MSFTKTIRATSAGVDSGPYTIYHTSVSAPNIVASGVSRASLLAGVLVTLPDGTTDVIVVSDSPCSNQQTVGVVQFGSPEVQAYDLITSEVLPASATINWTSGSGTRRAVFVKEGGTGSPAPANGTTYIANASFGTGDQIGATGWYCVYDGTGSSVNVTNLVDSTPYRVMVCEYNGTPGNEVYNTSSAANNPIDFNSGSLVVGAATLLWDRYEAGTFFFELDVPLTDDIIISKANVRGTDQVTCTDWTEADDIGGTANPGLAVAILAGDLFGQVTSVLPMSGSVINYNRSNSGGDMKITVLGKGEFSNGGTFDVNGTTVTVSIPSSCDTYTN